MTNPWNKGTSSGITRGNVTMGSRGQQPNQTSINQQAPTKNSGPPPLPTGPKPPVLPKPSGFIPQPNSKGQMPPPLPSKHGTPVNSISGPGLGPNQGPGLNQQGAVQQAPNKKPDFVPPKPLGKLKQLSIGNIDGIVNIGNGHPVWLVNLDDGTRLVVKSELGKGSKVAPQQAQAGSILMNIVSKGAVFEYLTPEETKAFVAKAGSDPNMTDVRSGLRFLTKMEYTGGMEHIELPKKPTAEDKVKLANLAFDLKGNVKIFASLGEVIAVDFFIGNSDRSYFDVESSAVKIQNPGNILFQRDGKGRIVRALGLDTFDPHSGESGKLHGTNIEEWSNSYGKILQRPTIFPQVGKAIVNEMNRWMGLGGVKSDFGSKEADALGKGMTHACVTLGKRLQATASAGKKMPSGVMARGVFLGWIA